jgi:septum site-determining protein MinD
VLAVTGGKGGVGKTTTALGVAAVLARDGRRPVVVDADLDLPDLARVAGVPDDGLGRLADGAPLSAVPTVAGVAVVGSADDATLTDLQCVLDRLARQSRPVVVDCPAGVGAPHGLALRAASEALLVTRPTRQAVADALRTGTLARRLGATPRHVALTGTRHVPTGFDRTGLPPTVAVPSPGRTPPWRGELSVYEPVSGGP